MTAHDVPPTALSLGRLLGKGLITTVLLTTVSIAGTVAAHLGGSGEGRGECALVFGAAVRGQSTPGPALQRRAHTAADLYRQGKVRRLVLTGGRGEEGNASEASVLRSLATGEGVNSDDTVLEEESHSTEENLRLSLPLLTECDGIVAVSDGYHLARIEMLADRLGLPDLSTYPADPRPPLTFEIYSFLREIAAYGAEVIIPRSSLADA